jgi:SPP1 family predicted phage head-tail adaptor
MRMIEAGTLIHRIEFVAPVVTRDANNAAIIAWTNVICGAWASIKPLSGKQLAINQANTVMATATHEIRIRYNPQLVNKTTYRVKYQNRYFAINAILDTEERRFEMRLTVTEVVQ